MKKIIYKCVVLFFVCIFLVGCWDWIEINDIVFVVSFVIDKKKD